MKIEKRAIGELKPAEYNPRKKLKKGDAEYKRIQDSLNAFGYVDPVIINADNTIIGGHQRATVLQDLGYDEIDCVIVDISKDQEKALNIALNKITGEWDTGLLQNLLEDLKKQKFDLSLTGFSADEVEKLFSKKKSEGDKPEVEFTEELCERHNYLVLYFDNDVDWLNAQTIFDIKSVKALPTRKDGEEKQGFERIGVGRVLNGAKALQKILGNSK